MGHVEAFEALVRRYQRWVFTLALRMVGNPAEAEDMAQEIFLKAYRGLKDFKGASRFSTWLYSIASHHCLNLLDARRREPLQRRGFLGRGAPGDDLPTLLDRVANGSPQPDALLERMDRVRLVHAGLARLKEDHRLILVLRDIQGLSYEEIADTLNLELGTVRSRLHRARMELKEQLAPHL
jgi:RNA polymerase sigma-70 factor (ECF subfamily)